MWLERWSEDVTIQMCGDVTMQRLSGVFQDSCIWMSHDSNIDKSWLKALMASADLSHELCVSIVWRWNTFEYRIVSQYTRHSFESRTVSQYCGICSHANNSDRDTHTHTHTHTHIHAHTHTHARTDSVKNWVAYFMTDLYEESFEWMRHGSDVNESWLIREWVMAQMWMSHGSDVNKSSLRCKWVMAQMWMSEGLDVNEAWVKVFRSRQVKFWDICTFAQNWHFQIWYINFVFWKETECPNAS